MKKQTTQKNACFKWGVFFIFIVWSGTMFGQWDQNGDDLFYIDGKIGIGTQFPFAQLDINTNRSIGLNIFQSDLEPQAESRAIYAQVNGVGETQRVGVWANMQAQVIGNRMIGLYSTTSLDASADGGVYGVYTNNEEYNYFSGKVGIGVQTPTTKLDVAGSLKIADGTEGEGKVLTSDANGLASWQDLPIDGNSLWSEEDGGIFYNEGNVGIGTTGNGNNPYKLFVLSTGNLGVRHDLVTNSTNAKGVINQVFHNEDTGTIVGEESLVDSDSSGSVKGYELEIRGNGTGNRTGQEIKMRSNISGLGQMKALDIIITGSSDQPVYGLYSDGEDVNYFSGNVGIGVQTPSTALDVAGTLKIVDGTEGEGKVLTSDANGLATWQDPQGGGSSPWIQNGDYIHYNDGNVGIGTFDSDYKLDVRTSDMLGLRQVMINNEIGQSIGIHNQVTHNANNGVVYGQISQITSSSAKHVTGEQIVVSGGGTGNRIGQQISMASNITGSGTLKALDISLAGSSDKPMYGVFTTGEDQNFFDGKVGIGKKTPDVELDVNGTIHYTGSILDVSDERFKKDIQKLESSLEKIKEIDGVSYYMRKNEFPEMKFGEEMEYGFTAQDVEEVFPNLVRTNNDGYKSLNYVGIIPVLVEALKEQQTVIEELQEQMEELKAGDVSNTNSTDSFNAIMPASLNQNVPNPFSGETEITFYIPREVGNAEIILHNMQGTQIRSIPISDRGEGSLRLNGFSLRPGIYIYALVTDGVWIDTKKMLLR